MIVEQLLGVNWEVEDEMGPDGPWKTLVITDVGANRITRIPFGTDAAKKVGAKLSGVSLIVTREMPPDGPGMNGGGHG